MLAGFLQPDTGEILFKGKHLEGFEEKLVPGHKEIRLVHQDFKLYHRMTVEENLRNALIDYIDKYIAERSQELLDLCGIDSIRYKYVHEISGGEKQRLAVAMALSTEPDILLFDEPFSNLDLMSKSALLQEVHSIAHETGSSVILITHDSRDAMEIADRMMVLKDGKLIRTGTPKEIYRSPGSADVAGLISLFNTLSANELKQFVPTFEMTTQLYGLWPEDIRLQNGLMEGVITQVVFCGHLNKILLAVPGLTNLQLWAYDHSKQLRREDRLKFGVIPEKLFPLIQG